MFRPDRITRDRLAALEVSVRLAVGDKSFRAELRDISQNGLAIAWPREAPEAPVGSVIGPVDVRVDDRPVYAGHIEVISVREDAGARVVGCAFRDALLNTDDLLTLQQVRSARAGGLLDLDPRTRPWAAAASYDGFKAGVAEMRLFLEDAREQLLRLEGELPWELVRGFGDDPLRLALVDELRGGFVVSFLELAHRLDAAVRGAVEVDVPKLRAFSQRHLDAFLMQAPFFHRARSKPLGYPGDFVLMRYIYERGFEGGDLFARALQLAATETDGACMIRGRKALLRDQLLGLAHAPIERKLSVAVVGSGPCEEVVEVIRGLRPDHRPIEFVLFDQSRDALSFALSRLRPAAEAAAGTVKLVFLHESIRDLLRGPTTYARHGAFDAVVCSGLLDYLKRESAVALCANLAASLAPGGTLFVGNVVPELRTRWILEHHLDWFVHYRTRAELRSIAEDSFPGARVEHLEEESGYNPFVAIHRPG